MSKHAVVERVLKHTDAIRAAAAEYGFKFSVLAGVVAQESGGDTWAARAEPEYLWLLGDDPDEKFWMPPASNRATEFYLQRISWGLCQVMGAVAREQGFKGDLPQLCDPKTGMKYGAAKLAWCLERCGGDLRTALLRYNGGSKKAYPDEVLAWAEEFKQ